MSSATEAALAEGARAPRVPALDLIRGVAVLGILAINIHGFAGPTSASYTPRAISPADPALDAVFAVSLVLFEGKMRALFSLLFGAGMALFLERAADSGPEGAALQLRRLLWLGLFGYLHYLLLWWGDILFVYALAGIIVLMLHPLRRSILLGLALAILTLWQAGGLAGSLPRAAAEREVARGSASPQARELVRLGQARLERANAREMAQYRASFGAQVARKATAEPFRPLRVAMSSLGETVPLMLIGFVLQQWGFFTRWPRRRLAALAVAGIGLGGAASTCFAYWAWSNGFPHAAMVLAIGSALAIPHLLMALGYAAALLLCAPALLASPIGRRLAAAGRMAFSNYILTSLAMTALFSGWGLGLAGRAPGHALPLFVVAGWAAMLAWSAPWLARFRQGPLEWLWRSLVEGRALPVRRARRADSDCR